MSNKRSVCRLGDRCSGHGCFPPRINDEASNNVFSNGIGVHRKGDHWITHCFTGDVELIVNHTSISFKELYDNFNNNKMYNVKSYHNNEVIETQIKTMFKRSVYEILEITLENNITIKCTPDHLFLLKDGTYKEAQNLTECDNIEDYCL
jgi:hypothetical protein